MHSAGEASFAIRRARREDAPAIAAVNVASGRVAWAAFLLRDCLERFEPPVERWEERLASDGVDGAWVALADGEIVGFVTTRPCWEGSETGEVTGLYTHPDVWGKGIGRALLERGLAALAASGCREATLWTEERNRRPRDFYAAGGWRPDGETRKREFLGCPISELRLRISLAPDEPA